MATVDRGTAARTPLFADRSRGLAARLDPVGPARAAEFTTSSRPARRSPSRSTPGWSRRPAAFARRRAAGSRSGSFRQANSVRIPTCCRRCAAAGSSSSTSQAPSFRRSRSGAALTNVGFAFSGYDQVWPAMDGDLGRTVRAQIEKTGRARRLEGRRITAFARSPRPPSRSRRPRTSRAITSASRSRRFSRRCSRRSGPTRPRSTSTSCIPRCKRISSTARRTALSRSNPASSTRCRNTSP